MSQKFYVDIFCNKNDDGKYTEWYCSVDKCNKIGKAWFQRTCNYSHNDLGYDNSTWRVRLITPEKWETGDDIVNAGLKLIPSDECKENDFLGYFPIQTLKNCGIYPKDLNKKEEKIDMLGLKFYKDFSKDNPWYCYQLIGHEWQVGYSKNGGIVKAGFDGWFATEEDAQKQCNSLNAKLLEDEDLNLKPEKVTLDITGLTKEEALAKIEEIYKKPWLDEKLNNIEAESGTTARNYYMFGSQDTVQEIEHRLKESLNPIPPIFYKTIDDMGIKL